MKHAILGAGAIGGLMGTKLASIGEDVIVIVRPDKLSSYPARLTLERPAGTITAPARAVSRLTEPVEALWIATKTFQLSSALESVAVTPQMIIPLLNGTEHMDFLRQRFAKTHVLAGTIAIEAERIAPGRFLQVGQIARLNLIGTAEPALGPLVSRMNDSGFASQFMASEPTLLWSKLCFLGPFAMVTSASGMNKEQVFADPEWKKKAFAAVAEACVVARAPGAEVDAAKIQSFMENAPAAMRSSMQKDVAAGRPTELDAIGGAIVRAAEQQGIDVPVTRSLISAIQAKAAA